LDTNDSQTDEVKIANLILGYLSGRPHAMDTIEGIAEWWILSERIDLSIKKISTAIQYLMKNGYLKAETFNGQKTFYQLSEAHRETLQSITDRNFVKALQEMK